MNSRQPLQPTDAIIKLEQIGAVSRHDGSLLLPTSRVRHGRWLTL